MLLKMIIVDLQKYSLGYYTVTTRIAWLTLPWGRERSKSHGADSVGGQFERYDGPWPPFERGESKVRPRPVLAIDSERGVGRKWRRNALKSPVQRKEKAGR
jgi:hypothetical protein